MLVLTRKVDESILVGDDVEIIVVEIRGDQVRLGISAPRSIPIYRKELYQEVAGETKLAARNVPADVYAAIKSLHRRTEGKY